MDYRKYWKYWVIAIALLVALILFIAIRGWITGTILTIVILLSCAPLVLWLIRYPSRKLGNNWTILAQKLGVECHKGGRERIDIQLRTSDEPVWTVEGQYRNHDVILCAFWRHQPSGGGQAGSSVQMTRCTFPMANLKELEMTIASKNILRNPKYILHKMAKVFGKQDIKLNHPQFDKKYLVQGNDENAIKDIFDIDIQSGILGVKYYIPPIKVSDDETHFEEEGFIYNIERLKSLIDITIDIVERIEASA